MTLDPDTANPHLVLSEDRRSVRWDETPQNLPDNPQRFDTYCSVLGHEGFTAGRHYWEVQLGNRGFWAVGVARDSAWRKGWISLDPSQGIWAVGICGDRFQAFTSFETVQPLNGRPRTIRVSLDYDKGQVAFFDADNETLAFAFTPTSFNGEKILPFFWVWESKIQLAPWDSTGSKMETSCFGEGFALIRETTLYFRALWVVENKVKGTSPGVHLESHIPGDFKSGRLRKDHTGQISGLFFFFNIWVLSEILLGNISLGGATKWSL